MTFHIKKVNIFLAEKYYNVDIKINAGYIYIFNYIYSTEQSIKSRKMLQLVGRNPAGLVKQKIKQKIKVSTVDIEIKPTRLWVSNRIVSS